MLPYLEIKPEPEIYRTYKWHREIKVYRLLERQPYDFESVEDEVWMDGKVPDIVAISKGRKLLIEIVVTHDIDEEKLEWIREHNLSTLRVSLGLLPYDAGRDVVKQCLLAG